jgi:hypothetical protein
MMNIDGGIRDPYQRQDLDFRAGCTCIGPAFIVQQALPGRIHRSGSVTLRQLGEARLQTPRHPALLSKSLSWIPYRSNRVIHDGLILSLFLTAEAVILKQLVFK